MSATSDIQMVRMPKMYGDCECVKAMRDGEQIARAGRYGFEWLIAIDGSDDFNATYRVELSPASNANTAITVKSRDEILADVESILFQQIARFDALRFARAA